MGKYFIIVIVVVALVGGGLYLTKKPATAPEGPAPTEGTTGVTPLIAEPPTANIDGIANDILKDNQNDVPPAAEASPSMLDENSAALDGFGGSLDGSRL